MSEASSSRLVTVSDSTVPVRFPIEDVRSQFPALGVVDGEERRIYLDNPAGTQVPSRVPFAAAKCMIEANANLGGYFRTSELAGERVSSARRAMARFLGAESENEIIVGPSMTALTFMLSRSIARTLQPGDEIVVTRMDHDANIAPWLAIAEDRGLTIRWLEIDREAWRIEPESLDTVLNPRTRLMAVTYASNLTGSINDVRTLVAKARSAGVLTYVDAVQYAPHALIDVQEIGCDFLACSAYKFFGPHLGVLYGRAEVLASLPAYKVRPAKASLPWRFEQGTPQVEMHAALSAAVEYVEWLGSACSSETESRPKIRAAFEAASAWENAMTIQLLDGLRADPDVSIIGISDRSDIALRLPTVSFKHRRLKSAAIALALARCNVFVWSGFNYSLELVRSLDLDENDGVVRIGIAHYNTPDEIERTLGVLRQL